MSGIGKGIAAASIGAIIQARGFRVTAVKIDPYVNVDAGTMNPTEHGEVFVLEDGRETDQDMGNYERFLGTILPSSNYMTTGSVYRAVIERERNLGYQGKCVQIIPHVTDEVIKAIKRAAQKNNADFVIVEIGGTIGDYENMMFLEAARQLKLTCPKDVLFVMIGYLPCPAKIGEMKTKPTQQAAKALNMTGIQADIIIARSEMPLDVKRKEKIGLFCNVEEKSVISAPDIESVYEVPVNFERDNLSDIIFAKLRVKPPKKDLRKWRALVNNIKISQEPVKIGIVGKYFSAGDFVLTDSYISVIEAIKHASYFWKRKPEIFWLGAEKYEKDAEAVEGLAEYDGIIVPGGFGVRGAEGKIRAINFCRERKIPLFGLCYGMQLMVIEFARNIGGLIGANTTEIDRKTKYPVIDIMPEQKKNLKDKNYGATMRLGAYEAVLKAGTIAREAYGKERIFERHRHRWEVNPRYVELLEKLGLVFSGRSADGRLMEVAELPRDTHHFFVGSQFHPEFKSSPLSPHPLFKKFIQACFERIRHN